MKRSVLLSVTLILLLALSACGHEHTWSDASCTAPRTCTACGATEGDPLGHLWTDATCETPKTCTTCAATEGDAAGHSWKMATCLAPTTCTVCGFSPDAALADHSVETWDETVDATCTDSGSKTGVCKFCAETVTLTLDPIPHSFSDWQDITASTCAAEGQRSRACSVCLFEETESVDMLPHELQDWVLTTVPTYSTPGEYTQSCNSCQNIINTKPYTHAEAISQKYTLKGETEGFVVSDVNLLYTKSSFFVCVYPLVEITNTGSSNLFLTGCNFDYVDQDGRLIGVSNEFSVTSGPSIIAPGEKGYFFCETIYTTDEIDISNGIDTYAYITVEKTKDSCTRMDVTDHSWRGSNPAAIGRMTNNSGKEISEYYVFALYRDASGRICNVGYDWDYNTVASGDSLSFEAPCLWREIDTDKNITDCEIIAFEKVR